MRNYRKEYDNYQGSPKQRKRNDARKKARRKMVSLYGKAALNGKDIDHSDRNPFNNSLANLKISTKRNNRKRNG